MILTTINQFDAKTDTMNMIHGDNCTKQEWIDGFNLPGKNCLIKDNVITERVI